MFRICFISRTPEGDVEESLNNFFTSFSFSVFSCKSFESFSTCSFVKNFLRICRLFFASSRKVRKSNSFFIFFTISSAFGRMFFSRLINLFSFLYISRTSSFSFAVTLLRLNSRWSGNTLRTLQISFLFDFR